MTTARLVPRPRGEGALPTRRAAGAQSSGAGGATGTDAAGAGPGDQSSTRVAGSASNSRPSGLVMAAMAAMSSASRVQWRPVASARPTSPCASAKRAVGEAHRLNIHSRILKEHIMNIKSKTFGWTCRRNRASVGSRPASGLFAVAAGKHAIPLVRRAT